MPKPSSLAHQGRPLCISSESWPGGRSGIRSIDESIFLGTVNEVGFEGRAWEPCPTAGATGYRPPRGKEPGDNVRWPWSSAAWLLGVNRLGEWLFACNMTKCDARCELKNVSEVNWSMNGSATRGGKVGSQLLIYTSTHLSRGAGVQWAGRYEVLGQLVDVEVASASQSLRHPCVTAGPTAHGVSG